MTRGDGQTQAVQNEQMHDKRHIQTRNIHGIHTSPYPAYPTGRLAVPHRATSVVGIRVGMTGMCVVVVCPWYRSYLLVFVIFTEWWDRKVCLCEVVSMAARGKCQHTRFRQWNILCATDKMFNLSVAAFIRVCVQHWLTTMLLWLLATSCGCVATWLIFHGTPGSHCAFCVSNRSYILVKLLVFPCGVRWPWPVCSGALISNNNSISWQPACKQHSFILTWQPCRTLSIPLSLCVSFCLSVLALIHLSEYPSTNTSFFFYLSSLPFFFFTLFINSCCCVFSNSLRSSSLLSVNLSLTVVS